MPSRRERRDALRAEGKLRPKRPDLSPRTRPQSADLPAPLPKPWRMDSVRRAEDEAKGYADYASAYQQSIFSLENIDRTLQRDLALTGNAILGVDDDGLYAVNPRDVRVITDSGPPMLFPEINYADIEMRLAAYAASDALATAKTLGMFPQEEPLVPREKLTLPAAPTPEQLRVYNALVWATRTSLGPIQLQALVLDAVQNGIMSSQAAQELLDSFPRVNMGRMSVQDGRRRSLFKAQMFGELYGKNPRRLGRCYWCGRSVDVSSAAWDACYWHARDGAALADEMAQAGWRRTVGSWDWLIELRDAEEDIGDNDWRVFT